jgi:toxin ParE1/3/4
VAFRLTRRAAADVRRIHGEGSRLFGHWQADRYAAELQRVMDLISATPEMARERRELSPPTRVHPCGAHVIVYVVEPGGDVLVVRVRHAREDWARSG